MRAGRIIAFITAAVFILFGFLFILGAFSAEGSPGWIFIGLIGMVIGFVLIFVGTKLSPPQKAGDQVVNLQVDLPGEVSMDTIKCNRAAHLSALMISRWSLVRQWSSVQAAALLTN